jgi:hypothetical protein
MRYPYFAKEMLDKKWTKGQYNSIDQCLSNLLVENLRYQFVCSSATENFVPSLITEIAVLNTQRK